MSFSSSSPDLGHAVHADGTLKDASEITWTYDVNESISFPLAPSDNSGGQVATLNCHSDGSHLLSSGLRRTGRVPRPSQRALEAASNGSVGTHLNTKRKAPSAPDVTNRHVSRKVDTVVDDDDADHSESGDGATTEPADDDYESIMAMADADNQAINSRARVDHTADIRLIFRRDQEHKHPDTGKTQC
ncbi:hypothetical protein H4582DRAFT_2081867 [Lactarius indigo]|nr:hypothetical protein H4582DRAFT_2081867 [Lactarius indigo]